MYVVNNAGGSVEAICRLPTIWANLCEPLEVQFELLIVIALVQ